MNEQLFFYSSASLQRALWDALQKRTLTEEMVPTHLESVNPTEKG